MGELRFVPFKSFVDAGFFKELSDRKLNELRLSEAQLDVYATYDVRIAGDKEPRLSVSATSFGRFEDSFLSS